MSKDPIVEEIREIRDTHAAQYEYDLKAIFQAIAQEEASSGRTFMKLSPKRIDIRKPEATDV